VRQSTLSISPRGNAKASAAPAELAPTEAAPTADAAPL